MGIGDEIMAIGQARAAGATPDRRAVVLDRSGFARWHPQFNGVPFLAKSADGADLSVLNGPGARPYVDYARTTSDRWAYTEWSASVGVIPGIRWVGGRRGDAPTVLIEPTIKPNASPNKQWGRARWEKLVALCGRSVLFLQCGADPREAIDGVRFCQTRAFAAAVKVMARCDAAILPEGGLHHAAAAIGSPAVVLFGAMTRPQNTGYPAHLNLAVDDPEATGWRIPHPACSAAWAAITPSVVADSLDRILNPNR